MTVIVDGEHGAIIQVQVDKKCMDRMKLSATEVPMLIDEMATNLIEEGMLNIFCHRKDDPGRE